MRDIEAAAGEPFRTLGMGAIADDVPPSMEALAIYQQDARAWVATDSDNDAVAYVLVVSSTSMASIAGLDGGRPHQSRVPLFQGCPAHHEKPVKCGRTPTWWLGSST